MDIVVIGGGASGLLVALWCMKLGQRGDTVTVVDASVAVGFGAGQAYTYRNERFLLNVRAAAMSAYPDKPTHFVEWLQAHKHYQDAEGFVPRHWYAEYLQDVFGAEARQSAVQITLHGHTAVAIDRAQRRVTCDDGSTIHGDAMIVALGNLAPTNPFRTWNISPTRMVDWYQFQPHHIEKTATVALIGTGLTMVDQVIALHEAGHSGTVIALSRHGYLPHVHEVRQSYPAALTEADADLPVSTIVGKMRVAVAEAAKRGVPWQAVIDSVRPHTRHIWRGWGVVKQRRFLRHAKALWDIHRHRIAPEISHVIHQMITTGQLHIVQGRICGYTETEQGGEISYSSSEGIGIMHADVVVNCTGPGAQYMAQPVLMALAERGDVVADAHGLGVVVDQGGQLIDSRGCVVAGIWAIGAIRKGSDWECIAIPDIRNQAYEIAHAVFTPEATV